MAASAVLARSLRRRSEWLLSALHVDAFVQILVSSRLQKTAERSATEIHGTKAADEWNKVSLDVAMARNKDNTMQTDGQGVGLKSRKTGPCRPVPLQLGDFFFRLWMFIDSL